MIRRDLALIYLSLPLGRRLWELLRLCPGHPAAEVVSEVSALAWEKSTMLQVTLDAFSGRESPSLIVDGQEARDILRELSQNNGILTPVDSGYQGLGFRGVIIAPTDDTVAQRYGLPPICKIAGGASANEAKAQEIAERLIKKVLGAGPRDGIAFPKQFEKHLLELLRETATTDFDTARTSPRPHPLPRRRLRQRLRSPAISNSARSIPASGTIPTTSGKTIVITTRPTSGRTPLRSLGGAPATCTRRSPVRR
jgi:hypothetical protein